jgi:hypothetical protein
LIPEGVISGADIRELGGLETFTNVNLLDDFSRHSEVVQQWLLIGYLDPRKKRVNRTSTYIYDRKK